MVTVADAVREIEELPRIGVKVEPASIDWNLMSKRVWQKIDESKDVEAYYGAIDRVTLYKGAAEFLEDKVLQVNYLDGSVSEPLTAPIIVLGVGGHTKVNLIPGLEETGYMSSESLFGHKYPKSLLRVLLLLVADLLVQSLPMFCCCRD